jgi:hypothetical protein
MTAAAGTMGRGGMAEVAAAAEAEALMAVDAAVAGAVAFC